MSLFASFLLATFLSVIFVPPAIILAKKFGLVDDPKKRKHPAVIHTKSIPRAGGVPIFLAFLIATIFAVPESESAKFMTCLLITYISQNPGGCFSRYINRYVCGDCP